MAITRPSPAGGGVTPQSFAYLQGLLLRRTGTVLEAGKEYVVEARLHGLALAEGFRSVPALLEGLQTEEASGTLHSKVAEAMLNGETSFFRDLYPFEALRDVLLPEIIAKREATRLLHIWCAAAASGQEAYSIAMLLLEHFPQLAGWRIRLIASDVSETMLGRARAGVFNQIEVNRGLPARLMLKYFEGSGAEWKIHPRLRQMVEFQHINLAAPWPSLPQMDFIFMRNVLLYFNAETRKSILANVGRTLRSDGYFFLGGGETTLITDRSFEPVRTGKTVCYRIRG
ncbi:MAG TPA: protein-glutamate O-methyltransferase CheR [Candidatus Eisenbacteria bacterium]|nr:protein-glutamate O-methyltransferase CheR [Candidatus Eisenbacteria bacterium]